MSLDLHIFKQEFNYNLQTDHTEIHLIQIGKTIHEEDLIDILKEFRGTDSTDPFEISENDIYRVTLSY